MGIAAMLITSAMSIPVIAAVSEGPNYTNAVVAEQRRIDQFYQAEQSFQEKLKVGRERYNQKQIDRAKTIAAMSAELQARQQTVGIQPVTMASPYVNTDKEVSWFRPSLVVGLLALGFIGFGYYLKRQSAQGAVGQKRSPVIEPLPEVVTTSMADEIFFCKASGADGRGLYTQEGFVVLKGSMGRKENVPSIVSKTTETLRVKLFDSGVMREEDDTVIFEEDHLFRTPSLAAIVLMGRTANGWLEWKTKDGRTLDTMQRQDPTLCVASEMMRERSKEDQ
jgi:hypothetical protein